MPLGGGDCRVTRLLDGMSLSGAVARHHTRATSYKIEGKSREICAQPCERFEETFRRAGAGQRRE